MSVSPKAQLNIKRETKWPPHCGHIVSFLGFKLNLPLKSVLSYVKNPVVPFRLYSEVIVHDEDNHSRGIVLPRRMNLSNRATLARGSKTLELVSLKLSG